ncbi:hypothetical protein SCHIN_v1c07820 [Spiroplasma chinense]|uniref:Uncharacterized protein n=1 Tax=Spiroplasma chinense TaxID=216932 RepID=A0A5B9Y6U2_9MOLU|nr:hypothetical protein [Spiroplasma chinense]QEH61977.1 hypothetical protein SCHIN_v1c07820 [Spiroplasma chinense]
MNQILMAYAAKANYKGAIIKKHKNSSLFFGYLSHAFGDKAFWWAEYNKRKETIQCVDDRLQMWGWPSCTPLDRLVAKMFKKYVKLIDNESYEHAEAMDFVIRKYDFATKYWKKFKRKSRPCSLLEFQQFIYGDEAFQPEKDFEFFFKDVFQCDEWLDDEYNEFLDVEQYLQNVINELYLAFDNYREEYPWIEVMPSDANVKIQGIETKITAFPFAFDIEKVSEKICEIGYFDHVQKLAFKASFAYFIGNLNENLLEFYMENVDVDNFALKTQEKEIIKIYLEASNSFALRLREYVSNNYPVFDLDKLKKLLYLGEESYEEVCELIYPILSLEAK